MDIDTTKLLPPEELAIKIARALAPDLRVQDNGLDQYIGVCQREIEEHLADVTGLLRAIVDDWESMMGEDDKSLYSLGLRHAIDIVYGRSPERRHSRD